MSLELRQIAERAAKDKNMVFTTLAHLIDEKLLYHSYNMLRKDAASGVDEQTAEEYAENLVANIKDLHERLKQKRYRALPVKRVWLDKEDGKKRPIGITAFEDKIVQRAAVADVSTTWITRCCTNCCIVASRMVASTG
jgi:retron-type reverse transcriptase